MFEENDILLEKTPFQNARTQHEVVIDRIFSRVYNKNPGLYIARSFHTFLGQLSTDFLNKAQFLDTVHKLFKEQQISMEDPNDEIWVKISGDNSAQQKAKQMHAGSQEKGLTKHRVKKIYRYVSQQCLYVMTSLILCIEQVLFNQWNPVKLASKQKQDLSKNEESKG